MPREIDIKLCQNYTKTYIFKILYKNRNIIQIIFNKYATNLKTTISKRSQRNSGVLLLLFEFNNFSILIDILIILLIRPNHLTSTPTNGSVVLPSVLRDQYTALSLEVVLVTWYGQISYIYKYWYNLDTVLCLFLETGTSDKCLIGILRLLRFSGFILYPLSFFLYSPFKKNLL